MTTLPKSPSASTESFFTMSDDEEATVPLPRLSQADPVVTQILLNGETPVSLTDFINDQQQEDKVERIESIQLTAHVLGDTEAAFFKALAKLSSLQHVILDNVGLSTSSARQLGQSLPFPTLLSLSVPNNPKLGPRGCKALAEYLKVCQSLQLLNLSNASMGHFGAQAIGTTLPITLVELDLSHNNILHDGLWKLAASRLSLLTRLKKLDLSHNNIADDGCLEIANHLIKLTSLEYLNLSQNDIGDTGIELLASNLRHSQLQQLDLSHNRIGNAGATKLAHVLQYTTLQVLQLSYNQIADDGCTALAQGLLSNDDNDDNTGSTSSSLHTLVLSHNTIGDEGAGAFVEHLDSIPTLCRLDLTDNPNVSSARTRILDMLLKHRTLVTSPRPTTTTTISQQQDFSERSYREEEQQEQEIDDDGSMDEQAIQEGRETLAGLSLEAEDDLVELPSDYIAHVTNHYSKNIQYGAFGKLYTGTDEALHGGATLLIRRVELSAAGPMEAVRQSVLSELAKLRHPNLLPILAYSTKVTKYYFVYDGNGRISLRDCLADETKRRKLSWKIRIDIIKSTAKALDHLHTGRDHKTTFHGDVKPDNIFLSTDDYSTAQLSDSGLSRLIATDRSRFASGDVVFGSRGYRCPRYERGSCKYDTASDIFSFGVVVGEVMTGCLQRSPAAQGMARDIYYDNILTRKPIVTDTLAGLLSKANMETLGKIVISCMSPVIIQRPTASTVAHILGQINL